MTTRAPSPVASGVPLSVLQVGEGDLPGLGAFLGETWFCVEVDGRSLLVQGCGSRLDDLVRFHEKDPATGRDVRVWHVTRDGLAFRAEHVAAF